MSSSAYINGSLDYPLQKHTAHLYPGHEVKWFYDVQTYHGYNKIKHACESARTTLSRQRFSVLMSVYSYFLHSMINLVNLVNVFQPCA